MRASSFLLLVSLVASVRGDGQPRQHDKELIMLEIERLSYPEEEKVVKRQAQVQYGGAPGQFIVRTSDSTGQQQVPPEYLTLLQQLTPQQTQQRNIDQLYITRSPQETYAEFSRQAAPPTGPVPPRPHLSPQQEQMRRLQEEAANKHIREQQERALHRALQTGQFQTGFQPQPYQTQPQAQSQVYQPQTQVYQPQPQVYQQPQPSYQPQQPTYQPQEPVYQPQPAALETPPQSLVQYDTSSSFDPDPQYAEPPSPSQYFQQTRSIRPSQIPKKFSYSQVQFGSSDLARETLEPRLVSIQQRLQNQVKIQPEYFRPQPPPQPQPQPQSQPQLQPQPQTDFNSYNVQPQQQTPTQPQHPEQYLIETTKPAAQNEESVVRIPRPKRPPPPAPQSLYFRPEPATISNVAGSFYKAPEPYTTIPIEYQRQYPPAQQYVPRPQNLPTRSAPSRSAIYVQQSGISKRVTTQQPPSYRNVYPAYNPGIPRVPTPQGQRPLTASEITALSKAGFQISPLTLNSLQEPSEISPSYEDDDEEFKSANSKRQSQYVDERKPPGKYPKRIPKPVPLTETERKLLAEQGIRNLYRVESSESKDSPVTYVLAIDNTIRKRDSESVEEDKN